MSQTWIRLDVRPKLLKRNFKNQDKGTLTRVIYDNKKQNANTVEKVGHQVTSPTILNHMAMKLKKVQKHPPVTLTMREKRKKIIFVDVAKIGSQAINAEPNTQHTAKL